MAPPQDRDYDAVERFVYDLGEIAATVAIALDELWSRITGAFEAGRDGYHDRLDARDEAAEHSVGTPVHDPNGT